MVLLGREDETPRSFAIRGIRFHQDQALLTLDGCLRSQRRRSAAWAATSKSLSAKQPGPRPAPTICTRSSACAVWGTDGELGARSADVLKTGSNDVYVATGEHGQMLLPAVPAFVREVDLEHGRMSPMSACRDCRW